MAHSISQTMIAQENENTMCRATRKCAATHKVQHNLAQEHVFEGSQSLGIVLRGKVFKRLEEI